MEYLEANQQQVEEVLLEQSLQQQAQEFLEQLLNLQEDCSEALQQQQHNQLLHLDHRDYLEVRLQK